MICWSTLPGPMAVLVWWVALLHPLGAEPSRRRGEPDGGFRGRQEPSPPAVPGPVLRRAPRGDRRRAPFARPGQDVDGVDDGRARLHRRGPGDLLEVAAPARDRRRLIFGGAISLQLQMQALGVPISPFLLDMLPYLLSLAVLAVWGGARAFAAPGQLGTSVSRDE